MVKGFTSTVSLRSSLDSSSLPTMVASRTVGRSVTLKTSTGWLASPSTSTTTSEKKPSFIRARTSASTRRES